MTAPAIPEPQLAGDERRLFEKGVAEFNAGLFFECHDTLEELWSGVRGPTRDFFQGLIQVAVAFHHLTRGNLAGADSLLQRALGRLAKYPERYYGFELARLRGELTGWLEKVRTRELSEATLADLPKWPAEPDVSSSVFPGGAMPTPARHFRWQEVKKETLNPLLDRRLITGERMMLAQVYLKKGCLVPRHSHENEQLTYVLEGALHFWLGEDEKEEVVVRAGEVLTIPSNLPHKALALEDTLDVDVFSPPRQDWLDGTDAYLRGR